MANAHQTLQAQIEAATWVFIRSHVEQWRAKNPEGTFDDFAENCRQRTGAATDHLIVVEMENGSTREEAQRMIQLMR